LVKKMQFSYWVILNGELIERRLAGSDTTATTLTLMLLQLVNHPTELAILIAEIDAAFPTPESPVTFETTQNLPYLNAVINEGMRCMPLVLGGLPRLVNHPTTINGYEIPPKEQQPIPTSLTADKSAFIPFSTGSRSCIGQQ
jgi:cytochrome P450